MTPEGYCQCGCGQKTRIATKNSKSAGQHKGQPLRFIDGHSLHSTSPVRRITQGDQHYGWKGNDALPQTKRARAQRRYSLGPCEICGMAGRDRHHKDGDEGNNIPNNIAILCRRCHMSVDGRIHRLGREWHPGPQEPKSCRICRRKYKPLRKGRCAACEAYFRNHGKEWTPKVKTTKKRHQGPIDTLIARRGGFSAALKNR